ncbi:Sulfate transporter/antisigma-factor antagonist STAS [Actinobacteria bacterium OK074]|nr:Sulfate transporter/antisigma-factor antagonist STAS [Actinobacteria bacterium OK074]
MDTVDAMDAENPAPAVLVVPPVVPPGAVAGRHDVERLADDVRALLAAPGATVVVCDVSGLAAGAGLGVVELLARLELAARRAGGRIRLRGAGPGLRALLGLVGLPFDVEGETEEGEPALHVEEAVVPGDPPG